MTLRMERPLWMSSDDRLNGNHGRNADCNAANPLCQLSTHSGGTASVGVRYLRVSGVTPRPTRQAIPSPSMPDTPSPIRVNRAPVLTLWATVVAERLGYSPETALTLGRFVAGSSAGAKARRLRISDEKQDAEERHARAAELKPRRQTVHLLGRDIPVLAADDGALGAEDDGKPASAKSVASYIARAFGDRLGEARAAMEALAASLPPEELNRVGFRLYERFRPDVPEGAQGWGAKGELRVERIVGAAG
jgi:hypothetical protein